jgi:hypothetical protein
MMECPSVVFYNPKIDSIENILKCCHRTVIVSVVLNLLRPREHRVSAQLLHRDIIGQI